MTSRKSINMSARAGQEKKDGDSDQGNDLKTLLSGEQREGFTLLVADIMELMKKRTSDIFDASFTSEKPKEQNLEGKNPNVDHDQASSEEQDKAQALREKREKEISEPKLQELKRLALRHFQKWEMSVIGRVGDVLNTKEAADSKREEAKNFAAPQPPSRPEYKVVGMSDIFKSAYPFSLHSSIVPPHRYSFQVVRLHANGPLSRRI